MKKYISLLLYLLLVSGAYAYIGPGIGAGVFAVVFGIIIAIFLGLVSIIWYPFKRLIKRFKKK